MIALPSKRVLCQYSQLKDSSIFGGITMDTVWKFLKFNFTLREVEAGSIVRVPL